MSGADWIEVPAEVGDPKCEDASWASDSSQEDRTVTSGFCRLILTRFWLKSGSFLAISIGRSRADVVGVSCLLPFLFFKQPAAKKAPAIKKKSIIDTTAYQADAIFFSSLYEAAAKVNVI